MQNSTNRLPEEGELVVCTVTNVQYHSVFAKMEEYGITGMIHISEIAAGRIRNINDYVKVGKVIVCKVLRIHRDRGHVDLSLRRVTDSQRRQKIDSIKREKKAGSILEFAAKELKKDSNKFKEEIKKKITENYISVYQAFEDVVEKGIKLVYFNIKGEEEKLLTKIIKQRIKPKQVIIKGNLELKTFDPEGIDIVKSALNEGLKTEGVDIRYLGGGKYKINVISKDYKIAESNMKESIDKITKYIKDKDGEIIFKREGKN